MASQPTQSRSRGLTLFSDEQEAYKKMLADGLDENSANNLISQRRKDIMGKTAISQDESAALLKMQADNISSIDAVKMIQDRRKEAPDTRSLFKRA